MYLHVGWRWAAWVRSCVCRCDAGRCGCVQANGGQYRYRYKEVPFRLEGWWYGGACAGGARGNMECIYSRYVQICRYTYVLKCTSLFMRVQDSVCRLLASVSVRFAGKNTSC